METLVNISHGVLVRTLLARHLDVAAEVFEDEQHLEHDLGLDPLDLVLVSIRLEEMEQAEFPVAALERVSTVGGLTKLVGAWREANARSGRSAA